MARMSKSDAQLMLQELAERLQLASAGFVRAVDNLNEALPGFPTKASGAVSGGGVAPSPEPCIDPVSHEPRHEFGETCEECSPVKLLPVERLAITPDPARLALRRLYQLLDQLVVAGTELYSIVGQWGYDRHQPALDLDDTDHEWCESCLRLHRCEPRHRGPLCRWCGTFVATQGRRPSLELLDAHHRGVRITARMIEADHPARRRTKSKKRTKARSAA